ncbi:hypothetical protein SAMN05444266_10348 [Chitinophaga jiangningensis]|uniref:Uncharacterized protein n=1 Tax=Chitinophaga jiangningensis TaxID=1419482 RepID=A0A1M6ZXN1_9BACT|nr:hypothetical protein [Chitinophaga jiangningensis]SHL35278.1 hypothetical protein SAMN05444266_10348 [Chitinophaga jiangningensis]
MKKKITTRLKLNKIKVSALNSKAVPQENAKGKSLVTTQFISCGATYWVC